MEQKRFRLKKIGDKGTGQAVVATLNVIDHDDDVILPGAIGQQDVQILPAHDSRAMPLGKAIVHETDSEMIADFRFNLDTQAGKEWASQLKFDLENGSKPVQEWSFAYDVIDADTGERDGKTVRFLKALKIHEISPVLLGAGINTRTLDIKAANPDEEKAAIASHSTATSDKPWDAAANRKRVRSPSKPGYFSRIYAWRDSSGDASKKTSYRFIHHEVGADGSPGPANIKACQATIGALNGGRGVDYRGQPWAGDRKGIWRHVARHLKDAGATPAPLKSLDEIDAAKACEYQIARSEILRARALITGGTA